MWLLFCTSSNWKRMMKKYASTPQKVKVFGEKILEIYEIGAFTNHNGKTDFSKCKLHHLVNI